MFSGSLQEASGERPMRVTTGNAGPHNHWLVFLDHHDNEMALHFRSRKALEAFAGRVHDVVFGPTPEADPYTLAPEPQEAAS